MSSSQSENRLSINAYEFCRKIRDQFRNKERKSGSFKVESKKHQETRNGTQK